jgi:hypothetical protein
MNNMITDSVDQIYYVLTVNGTPVSAKFTNAMLAEAQRNNLPAEQQNMAVVETVTDEGKQLLLG